MKIISAFLPLLLAGCAIVHHVQVGQVDDRDGFTSKRFEIKVSETGISTEELGKIAKATNTNAGRDAGQAAEIVGLFQMGPRTGKIVYNERYAEKVIDEVHAACPTGRVTGLVSIREMRNYPAVSGEIVKIIGYCLTPKTKTAQKVGGL